jgi:hypothetical protein
VAVVVGIPRRHARVNNDGGVQGHPQRGQVQVAVDPAELLARLKSLSSSGPVSTWPLMWMMNLPSAQP